MFCFDLCNSKIYYICNALNDPIIILKTYYNHLVYNILQKSNFILHFCTFNPCLLLHKRSLTPSLTHNPSTDTTKTQHKHCSMFILCLCYVHALYLG